MSGIDKKFWRGKRVFITGHTGFKGSWLCLWLSMLDADITGYALQPPTQPSLFELCRIGEIVKSIEGDIRDREKLERAMQQAQPEIVFHLAAQPLVRASYAFPRETYEVNVMGTVNILEAVKKCGGVKAVINVTSDKCYENKEWFWGYRETDPLGGYDPYSSSKACAELVTAAYRSSFFNPARFSEHGVAVATVRAGNVIGGGDWAEDRLIPDCIKALCNKKPIIIRNPQAVRPWQHVLEPLAGYMMLAEKLYLRGVQYAESWNFGPDDSDARPVEWIVQRLCTLWGQGASYTIDSSAQPQETHFLKLDSSKAKSRLGWQPRWNLDYALGTIIEWLHAYNEKSDIREVCFKQITNFMGTNHEY